MPWTDAAPKVATVISSIEKTTHPLAKEARKPHYKRQTYNKLRNLMKNLGKEWGN